MIVDGRINYNGLIFGYSIFEIFCNEPIVLQLQVRTMLLSLGTQRNDNDGGVAE